MARRRLDNLLVDLGLFETREKARRAIMAGSVLLGDEVVLKAARDVKPHEESKIRVLVREHAVSRAYYKLKRALEVFAPALAGRTALDIGSSTGGFTQCLLEVGVTTVWAVDCGRNQLDWRIRSDPRVIVLERTNARYLTRELLVEAAKKQSAPDPALPELAVIDVSFISTGLILPNLVKELGVKEILMLIKPQFEAGREEVGAGGLVREPATHRTVLRRVLGFANDLGLSPRGLTWSPITGSKGNLEFLAWLRREGGGLENQEALIDSVVLEAHSRLKAGNLEGGDASPTHSGL